MSYKKIIMEENKKNEVKELLGNITDFKSELLSGDEEMENPDGKTVEKYFNIKLKVQLDAKKSYSNIKIVLSDFLEELNLYMYAKVFNNEKLNKNVAKSILDQITAYFKDETEIEIDSFYPYISGEKIEKFFKLIKNYSFPSFIEVDVDPKTKYTVLVESTYSLKKNIIKKSNQLRKNFLFFSILNKFYKQYQEYLEEFYEFFIKRHIFADKTTNSVYDYKKDAKFDLTYFDNFIILFITNSQFKLFNEVKESIINSKPFEQNEIEFNITKCFNFPLIPKLKGPKADKKKFLREKEENNSELSGCDIEKENTHIKKDGEQKLFYSYRKFNYLINNINNETNFKVKIVYLDLYLNVLAPKSEIVKKLDDLNVKISKVEDELAKTKKTTKILADYISKLDPYFKFEDI